MFGARSGPSCGQLTHELDNPANTHKSIITCLFTLPHSDPALFSWSYMVEVSTKNHFISTGTSLEHTYTHTHTHTHTYMHLNWDHQMHGEWTPIKVHVSILCLQTCMCIHTQAHTHTHTQRARLHTHTHTVHTCNWPLDNIPWNHRQERKKRGEYRQPSSHTLYSTCVLLEERRWGLGGVGTSLSLRVSGSKRQRNNPEVS